MRFIGPGARPPAAVLAAAVLSAGLLAAGCAGSASRTELDPRNGVWEGSGRGWGGDIRVRLQISSSLIQELEVVSHKEDPVIGGEAMAELLDLVLDYQSTGLDAVSGATETSAGFLAAVEDALNRAGTW